MDVAVGVGMVKEESLSTPSSESISGITSADQEGKRSATKSKWEGPSNVYELFSRVVVVVVVVSQFNGTCVFLVPISAHYLRHMSLKVPKFTIYSSEMLFGVLSVPLYGVRMHLNLLAGKFIHIGFSNTYFVVDREMFRSKVIQFPIGCPPIWKKFGFLAERDSL